MLCQSGLVCMCLSHHVNCGKSPKKERSDLNKINYSKCEINVRRNLPKVICNWLIRWAHKL